MITGDTSKPLYYTGGEPTRPYLDVIEKRNGRYNYLRAAITALVLIAGIVFFVALHDVSQPNNPPLAPPEYSHGWWDAEADSVDWSSYLSFEVASPGDIIINISSGNITSRNDGDMLFLIFANGKWVEIARTTQ